MNAPMTNDDRTVRILAGSRFPQWTAFVLQFAADRYAEHGRLAGRVEHVGSGERADFGSADALLAFVRGVLARAAPGAASRRAAASPDPAPGRPDPATRPRPHPR